MWFLQKHPKCLEKHYLYKYLYVYYIYIYIPQKMVFN